MLVIRCDVDPTFRDQAVDGTRREARGGCAGLLSRLVVSFRHSIRYKQDITDLPIRHALELRHSIEADLICRVAKTSHEIKNRRTVVWRDLDLESRSKALEKESHTRKDVRLITFDVTFDEVDALQTSEQFGWRPKLHRELVGYVALLFRIEDARQSMPVRRFTRDTHRDRPAALSDSIRNDRYVLGRPDIVPEDFPVFRYRLDGVNSALFTDPAGEENRVVAEVGTDVDDVIARMYQTTHIVVTLEPGSAAQQAEIIRDKEEPAHEFEIPALSEKSKKQSFHDRKVSRLIRFVADSLHTNSSV